MRKLCVFIGLCLFICLKPLPGAPSGATGNSGRDVKGTRNDTKHTAGAPPTVTKQKAPIDSANKGQDVAPQNKPNDVNLPGIPPIVIADKNKTFWDRVLDWGPWISNFLLVGVGIIGVILACRTLRVLNRQATIMETQTFLTRSQLGQWAELRDWNTIFDPLGRMLWVRVHLVNPTDAPITLTKGDMVVDGPIRSTWTVGDQRFITPRRQIEVKICLFMSGKQVEEYDSGSLMIPIAGSVSHVGRLKETVVQEFSGRVECGKGKETVFHPELDMNPKTQDPQGQNPN